MRNFIFSAIVLLGIRVFANAPLTTELIESARQEALLTIDKALQHPLSPKLKQVLPLVRVALANAEIKMAAPEACPKTLVACVLLDAPQIIYMVNPEAFGHMLTFDELVEVLIHEGGHSAGLKTECTATAVQYTAYCYGRGRPPLFNAPVFIYREQCGGLLEAEGLRTEACG